MKKGSFYISVSNGLLDDQHHKRMGTSVWQFLWCLDKVTKIDNAGEGVVWGGKPVQLKDIVGGHRVTVSRNLTHLEKEGYLRLTHTPYGIVIRVMKMKKRFNTNAKAGFSENAKVGLTEMLNPMNKNAKPVFKNVKPNKTVSLDSNKDSITKTRERKAPGKPVQLTGQQIQEAREARDIIEAFSKFVNPSMKTMYGNKAQRLACKNLVDTYTFERVMFVIEKTLPRTNPEAWFPTITTPHQLFLDFSRLEAAIRKWKSKGDIKNQERGRGLA